MEGRSQSGMGEGVPYSVAPGLSNGVQIVYELRLEVLFEPIRALRHH